MRTIRYLGPAHRCVLTTGEVVLRGDTVEVSDQEADHMARSPHTWIEFVEDEPGEVLSEGEFLAVLEQPEADAGEGQSSEEKEQ